MVLEVKLMNGDHREAFIRRDFPGRIEYERITVEPYGILLLKDNETVLFPTPATRPCLCGATLNPFHGCSGEIPVALTTFIRLAKSAAAKFRGRPTPELLALRDAIDKMRDGQSPWGEL